MVGQPIIWLGTVQSPNPSGWNPSPTTAAASLASVFPLKRRTQYVGVEGRGVSREGCYPPSREISGHGAQCHSISGRVLPPRAVPHTAVGIPQTWCVEGTRKTDSDAPGQGRFIFSFCIFSAVFKIRGSVFSLKKPQTFHNRFSPSLCNATKAS